MPSNTAIGGCLSPLISEINRGPLGGMDPLKVGLRFDEKSLDRAVLIFTVDRGAARSYFVETLSSRSNPRISLAHKFCPTPADDF